MKVYHYDLRGSVTSITNKEGIVIASYSYSTYGSRTTEFGDENEIIGYNGIDGVLSDPDGLYYMRMRYYCVELNRFINEDILTGNISNSNSLNRYTYVQGNPVIYVDPSGMYPVEPGGNICEKELLDDYRKWRKSVTGKKNSIINTNVDVGIGGWLKLYTSPTVSSEGRFVEKHPEANIFSWGMIGDLADSSYDRDWFCSESPIRGQYDKMGVTFVANYTEQNLLLDGDGRYWIAMGPNIVNPEHPLEHTNRDISADNISLGTKVDVVVQGKDDKTYYIPCVLGDVKEHTYPDGKYQTGIPFHSLGSDKRPEVVGDGSTVEFIAWDIQKYIGTDGVSRPITNQSDDYKLLGILVYDGVYNYE